LEKVAGKWFQPYPFANVRENVDVILVALVLALGIRTFFFQPMAIPTGSMQPTLFGIMPSRPTFQPDLVIPGAFQRIFDSVVRGTSYYHVVAEADGAFAGFAPPETVFPFVKKQRLRVGDRIYTVWFPPEKFEERVKIQIGQNFRKGEDVIRLKVTTGDRLFVDRFSYNFVRPNRGDIIVFATEGIQGLTPDTHYIKRLVGLPGDKVQIGNDRHLIINGQRLDASTPKFENIYSFTGPPRENHYSGHVNEHVGEQFGHPGMGPLFPDESKVFPVRPGHYLVMGDNTMNSLDSRYWGDFPVEKVVGRHFFVFWPVSPRFGWSVR
jgi:signal peptidase I